MSIPNAEKYASSFCMSWGDDSVAPVCLPAAVDAISDHHDLPYKCYMGYWRSYLTQTDNGPNTRVTRNALRDVFSAVGVGSLKSISEHRVRTPQECEHVLEELREGGRRPLIYLTGGDDVVGLIAKPEGWIRVGLRADGFHQDPEPLTSKEIFKSLHQPTGSFCGRPNPNIVSLPSESKK